VGSSPYQFLKEGGRVVGAHWCMLSSDTWETCGQDASFVLLLLWVYNGKSSVLDKSNGLMKY